MNTLNVISAGVAGTSVMSAYSICLSEIKRTDFREPHLLAILIFRLFSRVSKRQSGAAGWVIHYLVGIFFAGIYSILIKQHLLKTTVPAAITVGALSGLVGVAAWSTTLNLHPHPPLVKRGKYYGQLVVAHIIFAIIAMTVLRRKRPARPARKNEIPSPALFTC
jgi:hypothetical protein